MTHEHTLHLPSEVIDLGQEFLDDDTPLEAVIDDPSPDLELFIRMVRDGEVPPLDLAARLMEQGYDVEALEISINL
jgi:hypothetical protein